MNTKAIGDYGEEQACFFLEKKGFTVTHRQYKSRFGEIDIVAHNGSYLVFAEVKLRKNNSFTLPREAVTKTKQEKIIKTAEIYLSEHNFTLQPRFDVIELYYNGKTITKIEHIENAFY